MEHASLNKNGSRLYSFRKSGDSGKGVTGFTLIEIMISLVVLLVVFLGLMQGALVSIDTNMRNILREEAVNIVQGEMNQARNITFANLASANPSAVTRNFRNMQGAQAITYTRARTVNNLDTDHREVIVTVTWNWKGQQYTYTKTTLADSNYWNL